LKYRSRTDIVAVILEMAKEDPVTKTHLFFASFLSFELFKDYLSILLEKGLLSYVPNRQAYVTTAKGRQYLDTYNEVTVLSKLVDVMKQETALATNEFTVKHFKNNGG
jgi:predicted transcriptional regulator